MEPLDFIPYQHMPHYPHMGPNDVRIWDAFIRKYPKVFDAVAYDVPVGDGAAFDTTVNPATGGNLAKLYQRKIDVVAMKDSQLWLIEVKPRASTASIGQIKGYGALFKRDRPDVGQVKLAIVTDEFLPEMDYLTEQEGVALLLVQ